MFAKVFRQSYHSSINADYNVRRMFWDLLVLADRHGVVDMTFDAIARETNVPAELVVRCMNELMRPDPESRSTKAEGARIVPLDSHRTWGWRIVNYEHYRNLRDEDDRRSYHRDYMRDRRSGKPPRRIVKSSEDRHLNNSTNTRGTAPSDATTRHTAPVKNTNLTTENKQGPPSEEPLSSVKSREPVSTNAEAEADVPLAFPLQGKGQLPDFVVDGIITLPSDHQVKDAALQYAKRLICEKILGGKNPQRPWSAMAQGRLAELVESGLPLKEIDIIGWWRSLPKVDDVPELKKRIDPLTETGLMNFWGDELGRAVAFWKKTKTKAPQQDEPPRWRDFFHWKYGPDINLPADFRQLPRERRTEYERDFQTFEQSTEVLP